MACDLLEPRPADPARRARRRRRDRQRPALRRADGLWRPPCRLLRHARPAPPRDARPRDRRLGRQRRPPGAAHGAADPRAAHPPREGDQQHLHRPGAAGGDGRRCTRSGTGPRASRRSRIASTASRRSWPPACAAAASRWSRAGSSTRSPSASRGKARALLEQAAAAGLNLRLVDDDHLGIALDETTAPRGPGDALVGARRRGRPARRRRARRRGREPARRPAPPAERVPHPPGVPAPSQRDRDAALPAPAAGQGSRPRPQHDPARLLHDEAQRDDRDDAGDLAGVRRRSIPFAPADQAIGYRQLFDELEAMLRELTGFAAISLQPNAGSQGEYAGLLTIRQYHQARGAGERDVCLIPSSAHGTNPASATMAGLRVVVVGCDAEGNVDLADLEAKVAAAPRAPRRADDHLSLDPWRVRAPDPRDLRRGPRGRRPGLPRWRQLQRAGRHLPARRDRRRRRPSQPAQDLLHPAWRRRPGHGADRRQGAPRPFLPGHAVVAGVNPAAANGTIGQVAAAPWGSPSILPISWAYIAMMGGRRAAPGDRSRDPQRQLHRAAPRPPLPDRLQRQERHGGARVHHRSAAAQAGRRHQRARTSPSA